MMHNYECYMLLYKLYRIKYICEVEWVLVAKVMIIAVHKVCHNQIGWLLVNKHIVLMTGVATQNMHV